MGVKFICLDSWLKQTSMRQISDQGFDHDSLKIYSDTLPHDALALAATLLLDVDVIETGDEISSYFIDAVRIGKMSHINNAIKEFSPFNHNETLEEKDGSLTITFDMTAISHSIIWTACLWPEIDLNDFDSLHALVDHCIKRRYFSISDFIIPAETTNPIDKESFYSALEQLLKSRIHALT